MQKKNICHFVSGWGEVGRRGIELNQGQQNTKWQQGREFLYSLKREENAVLTQCSRTFQIISSLPSFLPPLLPSFLPPKYL